MKPVPCSSCRRSERDEPAQFAVTGRFNGLPYRANLCAEHLEDMESNLGLEVRSCRRIISGKPSPFQLETIYRKLCATVRLDAEGLRELDMAREKWICALMDAAI